MFAPIMCHPQKNVKITLKVLFGDYQSVSVDGKSRFESALLRSVTIQRSPESDAHKDIIIPTREKEKLVGIIISC